MTELNAAMRRVTIPPRMARLPIDERGYLVPKFVQSVNGKPDFRAFRPEHWGRCVRLRMCWLCGEKLGRNLAFVIGPMCSVNRITSEPPSHLECARFATQVCPFMVYPNRTRNEIDLPGQIVAPAGIHVDRNPGVMCIWVTDDYRVFNIKLHERGNPGKLIHIGEPHGTEWWTQGRIATRNEAADAVQRGSMVLYAEAQKEGADAILELNKAMRKAPIWLPLG